MVTFPSLAIQQLKVLFHSSLYANSIYLIAASVVNTAFGFFFWTTAARLYRPQEVGLSAAAISAISLLAVLSGLGLDAAVVRFLPRAPDPRGIVNSSLAIGGVAALVSCVAFVTGLGLWSPALLPLRQSVAFVGSLIVSAVCTTLSGLCGGVFLARKQAGFIVAQSTIFGATKVLAALVLATVGGAAALVSAWALGTAVAATSAIVLLLPRVQAGAARDRPPFRRETLRDMRRFAFANYVVTVLGTAPAYLLPLLIVNLVGAEANAYYYVASSISGLLAMIPTAAALSLFAHGSHDARLVTAQAFESLRLALWLLVPALGMVWLFGGKLLLLFGRAYSEEGTRLLWVLALATVPMTVNILFFNVRRVQQRMRDVVVGMAWILCVTVGLSVLLLPRAGLIGVGATWFMAQASVALVLLLRYARPRKWGTLHGSSS